MLVCVLRSFRALRMDGHQRLSKAALMSSETMAVSCLGFCVWTFFVRERRASVVDLEQENPNCRGWSGLVLAR